MDPLGYILLGYRNDIVAGSNYVHVMRLTNVLLVCVSNYVDCVGLLCLAELPQILTFFKEQVFAHFYFIQWLIMFQVMHVGYVISN